MLVASGPGARVPSAAVHGLADPDRNRWSTVANGVTLVRTLGAVTVAVFALLTRSPALIVVGYAVYWVGDILDGYLARKLDQETRNGAVFDIVTDRVCTISLAIAVMVCFPWTALPVAIFLVQFVVVDQVLSLQFLRWPILSPNYFYLVDRVVFAWNWSPPAKSVNTASVVIVTAVTHSALAGAVLAGSVLVAKSFFLLRVVRVVKAGTGLDLTATPALRRRAAADPAAV